MGVLNVTPDSFSDGGRLTTPDQAVEHALLLAAHGADILDIGGESTRPQGAHPVGAAEELRRVLPVVERLAAKAPGVTLSVDTVKAEVAREVIQAGAQIINDVSGLRLDPRIAEVCAATGAGLVLMHSRGTVSTMATYMEAEYDRGVVEAVRNELLGRIAVALAAGVPAEAIAIDPGVGFAKRSEHSLSVLGALPVFAALGYPLLVGPSRKRFIGELTGVSVAADRDAGTAGACAAARLLGAQIFRVHNVALVREALLVADAILNRALVPTAQEAGG